MKESQEEAEALACNIIAYCILSLKHILPLGDHLTVFQKSCHSCKRSLSELTRSVLTGLHEEEESWFLQDFFCGFASKLTSRGWLINEVVNRGCRSNVGPWLDEERREDRVPQCVNVERLIVGFEKYLKAGHRMRFDLRIAVLGLLGRMLRAFV